MNPNNPDQRIVLTCDQTGIIRRILRDDFGLSEHVHIGSNLNDMGDPGLGEKIGKFFEEITINHAAYDWEIAVPIAQKLQTLHFAGACLDNTYLIMASPSRSGIFRINEEFMQINNEQANALRATAKELALVVQNRPGSDAAAYDELTKLNNEMANLQREMAKKNAELEELNKQKNRLLGMAAHDLRNPLGVILAYSEFLDTEAAAVLNSEQREFVKIIKDTSEFMLRMVTDLLDVTAIEAGQLKLDKQPIDLSQLVRRNVSLNRVLAAKKDIAIEFDPPEILPKIAADAGKIEQVLNNLIGNAVKFSHRGTKAIVRLAYTDGIVMVAVQDQGQGMPEADLPKLFKPFSKLSVQSTAGEQSTGLGLAIVRKIVEGHGGRIWVESVVGKGSTFFFTLPTIVDKLFA